MQTQFFNSRFGKVAFWDFGSGDQVLFFVHGLPTSKELFQPVLPYLNSSYRVIACDLNNYGESQAYRGKISHQERARVLNDLRIHLGIPQIYLISHDLGSSVAVDYLGKFSETVKKWVVISPPVYPDFREPFIVRFLRLPGIGFLLLSIAGPSLLSVGVKRGLAHRKNFSRDLLAGFTRPLKRKGGAAAVLANLRWGRPFEEFADYPEIIKSVNVPTLVIHGRNDPYIPLEHAERMHRDIVGSELKIIEDGSHFLPIDTPAEIARCINEFIGK